MRRSIPVAGGPGAVAGSLRSESGRRLGETAHLQARNPATASAPTASHTAWACSAWGGREVDHPRSRAGRLPGPPSGSAGCGARSLHRDGLKGCSICAITATLISFHLGAARYRHSRAAIGSLVVGFPSLDSRDPVSRHWLEVRSSIARTNVARGAASRRGSPLAARAADERCVGSSASALRAACSD